MNRPSASRFLVHLGLSNATDAWEYWTRVRRDETVEKKCAELLCVCCSTVPRLLTQIGTPFSGSMGYVDAMEALRLVFAGATSVSFLVRPITRELGARCHLAASSVAFAQNESQ